jgi:DNA replication protein DnaC
VTLPRQRGLTEQAADAAIDTACRLLRLPSIRNEFNDIADRAVKDQMTYRGFLAELLMTECDDRARRRSERRIKAAGFPREKSLRAFDFDANPNIDAATVHTLASCEWIKKSQPLCLIGDSGTGKSHMLIALGTEAAMKGYRVRYTLATKLVNELVEAADEKQLNKTIARYGRVDLLCIDELGYMELDRHGAELLFQVLTEREEKNSVAIASNESFGKAHLFRRTRARWRRSFTGSASPRRRSGSCVLSGRADDVVDRGGDILSDMGGPEGARGPRLPVRHPHASEPERVRAGDVGMRGIADDPCAGERHSDGIRGSIKDLRFGLLAADLLGDHPALNKVVQSGMADLGFLLGSAAVGDDHAMPAVGLGFGHGLAGGVRQHDTIGSAMVEQGTDGCRGYRIPISLSHGRGDVVAGGITAGVESHHPREIGGRQAMLGEEGGDGVAEGGIAVDQGVVEIQHQQRHDRQ